MVNALLPSTFCFLTDAEFKGVEYTADDLREDNGDEWFAEYDWNRADYEIVVMDDEPEVNWNYGHYDWPEVLRVRVIKRKSDKKYFKMTVHFDSWSSLGYGSTGSCGEILEVIPKKVTKVEYIPA